MSIRKLRVFLCHASDDKPAVRKLYASLKSVPWIDPWLDEENLFPGQDWDTALFESYGYQWWMFFRVTANSESVSIRGDWG